MTQEEKELLLKDLCARLPYGVKVQVYYEDMSGYGVFDETAWSIDNDFHVNNRWIENIKPYLRSIKSMTEEEIEIYHSKCEYDAEGNYMGYPMWFDTIKSFDYLNSIHVDYRCLIEKGLAIEVTENNNPYKDMEE